MLVALKVKNYYEIHGDKIDKVSEGKFNMC